MADVPQHFQFREYVTQEGILPAEGDVPVWRNVKVLGRKSANRREYTEAALRGALSMYEGAPVYLDHPAPADARRADGPRKITERFGVIRRVHLDADGIRGDLEYNPKHLHAEGLAWMARHQPDQFGLSHNATGAGRDKGGTLFVERITRVRSVDLVDQPATTRGLFEEIQPVPDPLPGLDVPAPTDDTETPDVDHEQAILDAAKAVIDSNLPVAEKVEKIRKLLKIGAGDEPDEEEPAEEEKPAEESKKAAALAAEAQQLREQLAVRDLIESSGVRFRDPKARAAAVRLLAVTPAKDRQAVLEEFKGLVNRPRSASPGSSGPPMDVKEFARRARA